MAFRYLIYSTGTTYADTILRESPSSATTSGETFLYSDFVIPEIQPLYLWRVTGGTTVVPNTDQNINNYLLVENPPQPDDDVTYHIFTGYTAQTETDLAGKINIVTGATGNLGEFDLSGNLVDTGWQISGLTGGSGQDVYVSGMTYIGSTLTLQRTEGFSDLTVSIVSSGASDGVVSGATLSGQTLVLSRTEGLPDVTADLSGLLTDVEADIIYLSGVTSGNTINIATNTADIQYISGVTSGLTESISELTDDITYISGVTSGNTQDIADNAADIAYLSGITDTKLDTAIFNTYTGDTRTELDLTITGATNGLTKSGRDVLLGGALTQNTSITGGGTFDLGLTSLNAFNLGFDSVSTITDSGNNGGLQYAADYSADYVDRSLVDKAYVDALASGLDWKNASIVATASGDTDLDLTGGTFAGIIDGRTLVDGDRVLIKNQDANPEQNGIYDYSASTSGFTRSEDFDGTPVGEVTQGAVTHIITGTTNENTAWVLTTPDPITVGVTPLYFVLFSAGVTYVAGVGIDISGNVISFDGAAVAGDFLQWTGTQLNVTGVTSQTDFNSFTAETENNFTYISGVTDQNTNDITYISGVTDGIIDDINYISGVTSGLTESISELTDDINYISGVTSGNTQDIADNTADIQYISGVTSGNTIDIATNTADINYISGVTSGNTADISSLSAETANKIDKVTGATGNLGEFTVDGNLIDTGYAISGLTGLTSVNNLQLVGTGVTSINTIIATGIDWHVVDYSGTSYNWSGGSSIFILEAGDYEVSYHLTFTQDGGGQDRSIGSYITLNGSETLDRTSAAGATSGADFNDSLSIPPTIFTFNPNDQLDLVCFRIGGVGSVLTNPFEQVILIKKIS